MHLAVAAPQCRRALHTTAAAHSKLASRLPFVIDVSTLPQRPPSMETPLAARRRAKLAGESPWISRVRSKLQSAMGIGPLSRVDLSEPAIVIDAESADLEISVESSQTAKARLRVVSSYPVDVLVCDRALVVANVG